MRFLRFIALLLIFSFVGMALAQEDLSWLVELLPTGDDINIEKQVLQGSIEIAAESQVLNESFSAENAWDIIQDRDGYRRIRDGRYEMLLRTNLAIYAGLGLTQYEDTIISVDSVHLSEELNDGYGLVCRANGGWENSYHFYISGDGYYNIAVYQNGAARSLTQWIATPLINQGVNAANSMTAVCVSDYLALYINGTLAAEARDSTYERGTTGMVVILFAAESEVHIGFDNLRVWEAQTDAPRVSSNAEPTPTAQPETVNLDEQRAATERRIGVGLEEVDLVNLAFSDTFDNTDNWTEILGDAGAMDIVDGFMRAYNAGAGSPPTIIFGNQSYSNTVIEADTRFVEGAVNNAFSLICRGSDDGSTRGYYFNLSSDGFFWVWASDGERFRSIVELDRSLAINLDGQNHITAVCVDDYFAFYANDTLVSEFYDDLYTSGTVGMMIYSYEGATEVAFDNLFVWEAETDN